MKNARVAVTFVFIVLLAIVARGNTVLLNDEFSGASLDLTKWSVILPNGGSTVVQSGGAVTTTGRGILATSSGFNAPYAVSGSFTLLNDLEHFKVALRTNLSSTDSFDERTGVIVTFVNDGNSIAIHEYTNPMANWQQVGQVGFNLVTGQAYSFEIVNTGNAVTVSVNGSVVLSASTSYQTGNRIAFYSREFSSTSTRIDSVTITSPIDYAAQIAALELEVAALTVEKTGLLTERAQVSAGLDEILRLLQLPPGKRSSTVRVNGPLGEKINRIIDVLVNPPGVTLQ